MVFQSMVRKEYTKSYRIYLDDKYNDYLVTKMINIFMINGDKQTSLKIIYSVLSLLKKKYLINPVEIIYNVIDLIRPLVGLRKRKVGGILFLLPYKLSYNSSIGIAIRWIKETILLSLNNNIVILLFREIINTFNGNSKTINTMNNYIKLLLTNRVYYNYNVYQ